MNLAAALLALLLAGCASPPARVVMQPRPPLDATLARPCAVPELPLAAADYDATDDWIVGALLPALEDCARRHGAIVRAW